MGNYKEKNFILAFQYSKMSEIQSFQISSIWQTDNAKWTHIMFRMRMSAPILLCVWWYNPPDTEQNDTDIVGQSIIQLSSEAFWDSFRSAWRRVAKQSFLAALCCFHHTNPSAQHELHPHPVCLLLPHPQRRGGHASLVFFSAPSLGFSVQP